jgi:hypothetical protein
MDPSVQLNLLSVDNKTEIDTILKMTNKILLAVR